ncbi:MAG: LysR family transcriptional regulator [Emcibacteraceae bacterium]|nr:LysR family transcriptional regulator [Emcibacteraceae bacterium]
MNWDDIRVFLAVARQGSVRNAALKLKVNHSTVSRRITSFEESLNVRLFERMPQGYLLTSAGEDFLKTAINIEEEIASVDRRIIGRDDLMSGTIRITLPSALGTAFLIEELAEFCVLYPDIKLDINCSYELADMNKREADLAIRITSDPPENLIGRSVVSMAMSNYVSKELWQKICDENDPTSPAWLVKSNSAMHEEHIKNSIFPKAPIKHIISDPDNMIAAVKAGMGISPLGCHFADSEPDLMRLPPGKTELMCDLWLLIHRDLRHTLRVKTLMDFTAKAILKHKDMLQGKPNLKLGAAE